MGTVLRLSEIPTDRPLHEDLYDVRGTLVINSGVQVTKAQLEDLARRGLTFLELGGPEIPRSRAYVDSSRSYQLPGATTSASAAAASKNVAETAVADADDRSASSRIGLQPTAGARRYSDVVTQRVTELIQRTTEVVNDIGLALVEGTLRDATPVHEMAAEFFSELRADADQVVSESTSNPCTEALAARTVQMSVLSMAICQAMKLPESDCLTAGSAALLHDTALFRLPESERYPHAMMKAESRRVYDSHPSHAYYMLESLGNVDAILRIVVLQVHEQTDGSGFPRRITLPRIHPLARVVGVADAYIRLVSCGGGGRRLYPADAIAYLMHHSCGGRFDPAVTSGLVKAVSLYPLGSLVQLNNEATARVIRCNADLPLQPVVLLAGDDQPIDLSSSPLCVAVPIDNPDFERQRLPAGQFNQILW
jgi:HD-GYP domain-containing protein (c-di-GMP phosphodiesterase class II)